jgi:hypothetical protein
MPNLGVFLWIDSMTITEPGRGGAGISPRTTASEKAYSACTQVASCNGLERKDTTGPPNAKSGITGAGQTKLAILTGDRKALKSMGISTLTPRATGTCFKAPDRIRAWGARQVVLKQKGTARILEISLNNTE